MKALVITNNKGGVLKTTLSVHCLWRASELGKKAILYDLDENQANAIRWCLAHRISNPEPGKVYKSNYGGDCVYMPDRLYQNYDITIIDTDPTATSFEAVSDIITHILVPFKGKFAREGIEDIIKTVNTLGWNGKIPIRAIPVLTDTTVQSDRDVERAKRIGIPLMRNIKYYPFVDRALEDGVPIWYTPWGVKTTIRKRVEEILEWINL